jgi:hypothetical protein
MKALNSWTTKSQAQKSRGAIPASCAANTTKLCEVDYAHLSI